MEMMMMVQGALQSVPNLAKRMQKVVRNEQQSNGTDQEKRKALVERCLEALKEVLHLPEKFKSQIYEEFDPILIINETFEQKLPGIFDKLLDFEGSDENFVKMCKRETVDWIGYTIGEIEDGFYNAEDIIPFLRENIKAMIRGAAEEGKAMMAELMIEPPVIAYINRANEQYKKVRELEKISQVSQFNPKEEENDDMYADEQPATPKVNLAISLSDQLA